METIQITFKQVKNEQQQLLEQLYKDISSQFFQLFGDSIPHQTIEKAVQYVILNSAFLDGFYFEGDVLKAVRHTLFS